MLAGWGRRRKGKTSIVSSDRGFLRQPEKTAPRHLQMGPRLPGRAAVVPSRRKGGEGDPRRAPAPADLPGGRLWRGVLDLLPLRPGPPVLQRPMPAKNTAATRAGRQPAAPAKPGRPARSPRPATGLPGTLPPPGPRDGSTFRRHLRFGQYRRNGAFPVRKRIGKRLRGGSICWKLRI